MEQRCIGFGMWFPKVHAGCLERQEQQKAEERRQRENEERRHDEEERIRVQYGLMQTAEGQSAAGIPPQYHGASLTDFAPGLREKLQRFYERSVPLMTLTGGPGIGKTRALYAIYRQALAEGVQCRFRKVPMLVKELQTACVQGAELNMLRDYTTFGGILLLDELGQEKGTEFVVSDLGIIIGEREEWGRTTALATNLSVTEIVEKLDGRIADRIAGGLVCKLKGKSRRKCSGDDGKDASK